MLFTSWIKFQKQCNILFSIEDNSVRSIEGHMSWGIVRLSRMKNSGKVKTKQIELTKNCKEKVKYLGYLIN